MNTEHGTNIGRKEIVDLERIQLAQQNMSNSPVYISTFAHSSKRGHLILYSFLRKLHVSFYRFPLHKNQRPVYMASWHKQEDKYKRWLEMATAFFDAYQCSSFSHKISIMQSGVFWPDSKISTEEHSRRC